VLADILLAKGASKVVCADFSKFMLSQCRTKFEQRGVPSDRIEYHQADATKLPFDDHAFDLVVSGMTLGLVVDQAKTLSEIHRVLKPGGVAAISTHGPEWLYEICDAVGMWMLKSYPMMTMGSSCGMEFWPLRQNNFQKLLDKAGFMGTNIRKHKSRITFADGGDVWDFFAACSSAWFLDSFKPEEREDIADTVRNYFLEKNLQTVTHDALMGYGRKQ